jgi:hypothetical protein
MNEDEAREILAKDFGDSYVLPTRPMYEPVDPWDSWANSIEIKLSTQGKVVAGVGMVAVLGLILTVLQGKVVITLVKGQRGIIEAVNGIIAAGSTVHTGVSYTEPAQVIDEAKVEPVNTEELEELRLRMEASLPKAADTPEAELF